MPSRWLHSLCETCWPWVGDEQPVRVKTAVEETCCRCGKRHRSGIYYRAGPWTFACDGAHAEPAAPPRPSSESAS